MTDDLYDDQTITFLEELWGEGFLSPGGPDEVRRVLHGVDITGKRVLDIGCGSGACAVLIAHDLGADHVTGIDVEEPVCGAARRRAEEAGLSERIKVEKVEPGPFPFPDGSFDVVFSKDSIIHIPDKAAMAKEAFRILKPGGMFAASDWLIGHDDDPSPEMVEYIKSEDLDFAMASPATYETAMREAGFEEVELVNRNPWYAEVAAEELAWLTGDTRPGLEERHGKEFIGHQVETWTKMLRVLEKGEHCPHHIRGKKPE
ncbi:methyltransferase domain-containing protein [Roseovarius sp.]|jgi:SAM-dependent methyltransferase|uniref:methyltransferase domain-containing protein n=1 Tax=Roseovarius sp. TaxID=1486281 RepID=UPI00261CF20C|nr:methyltransferase domain-containing protein [Roseovarius sp.]MDM8168665.1 methyltransferase domain-containing protein [Roseovarius sp.]